MAIFEFECPKGHVSDLMVGVLPRPATIKCTHKGCGQEAKFVLSATKTTFHAMDRKAIKRGGR